MNTNSEESAGQYQHHHQSQQPIDASHDQTGHLHQQDYASYPQISVDQATDHHDDAQHAGADGFGAPVMGAPSIPSAHPLNSQAATGEIADPPPPPPYSAVAAAQVEPLQSARASETLEQAPIQSAGGSRDGDPPSQQSNPYVQTAAVSGSAVADKSPMDMILENLNKLGKKAEEETAKLWNHLTAGPSVTDTAWGRINQGAKVLSEGGIENVFKQTFGITTNEQLRKSYACYLSTSTGPVVGTLYISTVKIAFCSDRPLRHTPTPDQQVSSYYKDKPAEKYIQIVTVDDHEFWFMGFVNYDKGLKNLQEAIQTVPSQ
ncbi:hypothetical protein O6H91_19G041200 [Diphasiastrum complanatum]|uniref:Uncharacterized protein n=1 Tax=Diphasiastrum complanatum TaxID=34168 RepID=A0ACC2AUD5_DIPCM|nr:hypothetical protein O6H91_19G041200 [Diphasiastrum complanatum]